MRLIGLTRSQWSAAGIALMLVRLPAAGQAILHSPDSGASAEAFADFVQASSWEAGAKGWGLALIRDGRVVVERYVGLAGSPESLVSEKTVFSAESNAKPVIAWAVMKLEEEGLIELDAPVERYLERFRLPPSPFDHSEVTVRRLLTHTSGLSWGRLKEFPVGGPLPSVAELYSLPDSLGQRLEVEQPPGSSFNYSSGGYALLQLLVEDVSGRPFSTFIKDEVLRPLGMMDTGFSPNWPSVPSVDVFGHMRPTMTTDATANDLRTSLPDLTRFALSHFTRSDRARGAGVLTPSTLSAMLEPSSEANGRRGLGYVLWPTGSGPIIAGHNGSASMFRVSPETGDGIVLVSNSNAYMWVSRIDCAWRRWAGLGDGCQAPSAHTLYGAYQAGGVDAAIDRFAQLRGAEAEEYLTDDSQLVLFAHLMVGAGRVEDGGSVFAALAESSSFHREAYREVAGSLQRGEQLEASLYPCYAGRYETGSGEVVELTLRDAELVLIISDLPWKNSVRPLSRRVFAYDPFGSDGETPGQIVFELDASGAAQRLSLSDPDLGLAFQASRTAPSGPCGR